jgi:hypothetical protein
MAGVAAVPDPGRHSVAGLAVLAVVVIVTGLQLRHWYDTSGIAGCGAAGDCDTVTGAFTAHYKWLQTFFGIVLIEFFPAVIGVFWGAPLIARELETGTHRLAWTQSVTRTRWLGAKITVVGTASIVASGLLSWMVTWWSTPFDNMDHNKFDPSVFSERDIAPLGYAAFAFALGVAAGLLIRRTLPAMATTLVGYIAARVVVLIWIRPHFQAPLHATGLLQPPGSDSGLVKLPGTTLAPQPGAWLVSSQILDPSGHPTNQINFRVGDPCLATRSCLAGYHQTITYQPASRYWPFQWYETSLFLALAVVLIGFSFWLINGYRLRTTLRTTGRPDSPTRADVIRVPDLSTQSDRATSTERLMAVRGEARTRRTATPPTNT